MIFSENRYPLFGIMLYRFCLDGDLPEAEIQPPRAAVRCRVVV
jgi:hypothetical protein